MPPITRTKGSSKRKGHNTTISKIAYSRNIINNRKTNDEYYRLLAYVQWSVDKGLDFKDDVYPMIHSKTYATYDSVYDKLYREWKNNYANGYGKALNCLFEFGTKSLGLAGDELAKIKKFYREISRRNVRDGQQKNERVTNSEIGPEELNPDHSVKCPDNNSAINPKGNDDENKRKDQTQATPIMSQHGSIVVVPHADGAAPSADTVTPPLTAPITEKGLPFSQPPDKREVDLRKKIFSLETEIACLRNENQGLLQSSSNPSDVQVRYTLQRRVELGHLMAQRERNFDIDSPGMSADEISRRFFVFFHDIRDACSHVIRNDRRKIEPDVEVCEMVHSWSRKTFKMNLNEWLEAGNGESMTKEDLLIGLVAAAVVDRAFQPAFPNVLAEASPTTNIYRDIIVQWYGATSLHMADFHLFQFLMGSRKKDLIEASAAEIESTLKQRLQFFWNSSHHNTSNQTEDHNDMMMIEKPAEAPNFKTMLKRALELKVDLTASKTRLRYVYFTPDDTFHEEWMSRMTSSDYKTSTIKACIVPALVLAPPRPESLSSEEYVLEYNVDYNMYFAELKDIDLSQSTLVARALVLT